MGVIVMQVVEPIYAFQTSQAAYVLSAAKCAQVYCVSGTTELTYRTCFASFSDALLTQFGSKHFA